MIQFIKNSQEQIQILDHIQIQDSHNIQIQLRNGDACVLTVVSTATTYHRLTLIRDINFPYLRQIACPFSSVESIETLSVLQAPLLQKIKLSSNNIVFVRPLIKLRSKQIMNLAIDSNRFQELVFLSEGFWPKLKNVRIDQNKQYQLDKKTGFQCLNFIAKIYQAKNIIHIQSPLERRIKQSSIIKKLLRKKTLIQ